jgi:hypothetical protein
MGDFVWNSIPVQLRALKMEFHSAFGVLGSLSHTELLWLVGVTVVLLLMTSSALAALGSRNPFFSFYRHNRRRELNKRHFPTFD